MGFSYTMLPRKYHKSLFADFSRTFLLILLISLMLHVGLVLVLLSSPVPMEQELKGIEDAQKRFASLILSSEEVFEQEIERFRSQPEMTEDEALPASGEHEGVVVAEGRRAGEAGAVEGEPSDESPTAGGTLSGARRRTREQIARDARSKGILGLITASGGSDTRAAEIDRLLGTEQQEQDLDEVLSGLSGVQTRERPSGEGQAGGREVRGGRTTEAGSIDELVTDLGDAQSTDITRIGELVVGPVTPLTKDGEVTRLSGRNPDDVSAIVNSHNDAIEYCYQKELKRFPNLRGKLVVRFTITPQGSVKDVKIVSSTLDNKGLERCIIRRIQRWDDFGVVDSLLGDATFRQVYAFGF